MNNNTQKIGGIAAVTEAVIYIFGFILLFTILQPTINDAKSSLDKLTFIIENKTIYQLWILVIYVVFGIVLVPLTIAINEKFTEPSLIGTKVTPIFGFIWSGMVIASGMIASVGIDSVTKVFPTDSNQALNAWKIIGSIQDGLGGGVELIGGLWVFLISITGLKQTVFPKPLNYLGLIVGAAGILTIVPALSDLGAVFGLLQIVWFAWIGVNMLTAQPLAEKKSLKS
jgi:hypothetical protein